MIRYDLVCANGHEFDGWFSDSDGFEQQAQAGHVSCSVCGTAQVAKQLMTPGIPAKSNCKGGGGQMMAGGQLDSRSRMLMAMVKQLREEIKSKTENVGERFAEEARRIHYGEAEQRGIHGQSTREEAHSLAEEGIEVYTLPSLPEDSN